MCFLYIIQLGVLLALYTMFKNKSDFYRMSPFILFANTQPTKATLFPTQYTSVTHSTKDLHKLDQIQYTMGYHDSIISRFHLMHFLLYTINSRRDFPIRSATKSICLRRLVLLLLQNLRFKQGPLFLENCHGIGLRLRPLFRHVSLMLHVPYHIFF